MLCCFSADLQAWTSLSFSTQSGRHAAGNRSRTLSPSIGSIRNNTGGLLQSRGTIASPVLEEDGTPAESKDAPQATLEIQATDSTGRRTGVRKSLHGVCLSVEVPSVENVGAEFQDDEQGTVNSDPSLSDDGLPSNQVAESPAKKRKKESFQKKGRADRLAQALKRHTRSSAKEKLLLR